MKDSTDMAPYLSLTDQRRLRMTIPPIDDRRAIARVLGALDDKIEVNREQNLVLEAMAAALFRSWFVDFDPVRAKAAGERTKADLCQTYRLTEAAFDALPTSFADSALGPAPKGGRKARSATCSPFTPAASILAQHLMVFFAITACPLSMMVERP